MSAQVKALSMIVAIEGLIPGRRAVSAQNNSATLPVIPPFYVSAWARTQQDQESVNPQSSPAPTQQEAGPDHPAAPVSEATPGPTPNLHQSGPLPGLLDASQTNPYGSRSAWVPDTRVPFSIKKNPFARRR